MQPFLKATVGNAIPTSATTSATPAPALPILPPPHSLNVRELVKILGGTGNAADDNDRDDDDKSLEQDEHDQLAAGQQPSP